jgi:two-component system, OmpR family, response regulator
MPAGRWRRPSRIHNGADRWAHAGAGDRQAKVSSLVSLVNRPRLLAQCAQRGLDAASGSPSLLLAAPATPHALHVLREAYPGAAIMALGRDEAHQLAMLEAGADDVAPISTGDALLAARLAALARRTPPALLRVGPVAIDPRARIAERDGQRLDLLPREYALLLCLARAAGRIVTAMELLASVWGLRFDPGTNVVAVHVSRLRGKLDRPFGYPVLLTQRGVGYRLVSHTLPA